MALTHGQRHTRAYKAWAEAKQRCHNPNNSKFKWYGARGISVCSHWRDSFENFIADMGHPGAGQSLDRIDNDCGYEPGNCRWADVATQANNKRNNRILTVRGANYTLSQASREFGVEFRTLWRRLVIAGWSDERAALTPVRRDKRTVGRI